MITDLYNSSAKAIGKVEIPDRVFAAKWNPDLVKQVIDAQEANVRKPLAHAKGRSEVRGGGRKPWKQKGTGRSRQGSIRSPIWKGGGVAHGPTKDKVFAVKINKKMKQTALFSVLSRKLKDGELKFVDNLSIPEPKTKFVNGIVTAFRKSPSALLVPSNDNKSVYRASTNIPKVKSLGAESLNVYDLLRYKDILIEKGAIETIDSHYHAI